jgi:hypothetical protein
MMAVCMVGPAWLGRTCGVLVCWVCMFRGGGEGVVCEWRARGGGRCQTQPDSNQLKLS